MFEEHCHNLDVDIVKERIEAEEADSTRTNFDCQVAAEANRKDQLQEQLHQKHLELDKLRKKRCPSTSYMIQGLMGQTWCSN